jgi:hypothetical protein
LPYQLPDIFRIHGPVEGDAKDDIELCQDPRPERRIQREGRADDDKRMPTEHLTLLFKGQSAIPTIAESQYKRYLVKMQYF